MDSIVAEAIDSFGAKASFYQYEGFPGHICISVNEQIIHGIPDNYKLTKSDIVTYDVGITYKGYICDAAFSLVLDSKNIPAQEIHQATLDCLQAGISQIKAGAKLGDISYAIQETAFYHGYQVIREYGGHGCGLHVHEDPIILNYGQPNTGIELKAGMVLCIEPMLLTDSEKIVVDEENG
ncbi:MAG: type I methionyl aminopeptidase [Mycoplasmoidaceae bacterium]|nr:type I methionyl aminopeptidase [Mycoplasmoidaceae bacterium]